MSSIGKPNENINDSKSDIPYSNSNSNSNSNLDLDLDFVNDFDNDSKGLESDDQEYEQELVFYRGDRKTDRQLFLDLNQLFIDIDCELQVLQLGPCVG